MNGPSIVHEVVTMIDSAHGVELPASVGGAVASGTGLSGAVPSGSLPVVLVPSGLVPSGSVSMVLRGRSRERAAMYALLSGAVSGRGGALSVQGDIGMGKTALLTSAIVKAVEHFDVLSTSGTESESGLAYAGLHRLLRPLAEAPDRPVEVVRLVQALERGGCDSDELFGLCVAVLRCLCDGTRERPLLCCVDDAQWLDRPSLSVLAFAARRVGAHRVAILIASRDPHPVGEPLAGVPPIRLGGLGQTSSREVLADLVPDGLDGDVAGVLATLAGGNPRALVDLAQSLTPQQCRGDALPPSSLPAHSVLRQEYRSRLRQLPASARWLVLLAAADEELDPGELIRAAAASGYDIAALEPAEMTNLIRVGPAEVTFPQPLARSIVYDEATLSSRRWAHALLAQTLDRDHHELRHHLHRAAVADGPDDALAACLYRAATAPATTPATGRGAGRATASRAIERAAALATSPADAASYLVAAARHAWEGGQPHRARILLRRVRARAVPAHLNAQAELLLGEIELRAGGSAHAGQTLLAAAGDLGQDRELAVNAMTRAAEALCLAGDYQHYADVARQALALRRPDETASTQLLFEQFAGLTAMFEGNYPEADKPLRRVLTLAHALNDAGALIRASMAAIVLGDDSEAYRLAVRAVTVARAAGDVTLVPQALELAGAAELALGRYEAAAHTLAEGLRLARATGQEGLASNMLATLAVTAAVVGDRPTCLSRVDEARVHTATHPGSRSEALIEWALGVLELVSGRPADALVRLQGMSRLHSGDTPRRGRAPKGQLVIQVAATPHLVEAAMRCGERGLALEAIAIFDPWASNTANPSWLALLSRCHALVAVREDEAEERFRQALHLHLAAGSEFERARTELLFGQELRRARRPSAAREHLRLALETFTRFRARSLVDQATAELRAAGEHVRHDDGDDRVQAADVLTAQQLQIAMLAADGATNREVAAQLFLSTRTVDHHMRNIFARLGIRSRVDLAKLII